MLKRRSIFVAIFLTGSLMAAVSSVFASEPAVSYRIPSLISVKWSDYSTGVFITSPQELSNVVLADCLGITYKYDHVDGTSGNFEHPTGQPITIVWVKSGNNESGDGPGYGERFDNPDHDESCVVPCRIINTCDPMPDRGNRKISYE